MSAWPKYRSTSCNDGASEPPAARSSCACRDEDTLPVDPAGIVLAAGGVDGAAVAQAESSTRAASEAMNLMGANVPPPAPRRNACHAASRALKRHNSKD